MVNNVMIRKKLFELTINFMLPFRQFLREKQFFQGSIFIKFLKNFSGNIVENFHNKQDMIEFYEEFMQTKNFHEMMRDIFDLNKNNQL